jgi:hypothetical protein
VRTLDGRRSGAPTVGRTRDGSLEVGASRHSDFGGDRHAVAVYWMITHVGGGLQWNAILSVGVGIFVLWSLFGNAESNAYFEGHP